MTIHQGAIGSAILASLIAWLTLPIIFTNMGQLPSWLKPEIAIPGIALCSLLVYTILRAIRPRSRSSQESGESTWSAGAMSRIPALIVGTGTIGGAILTWLFAFAELTLLTEQTRLVVDQNSTLREQLDVQRQDFSAAYEQGYRDEKIVLMSIIFDRAATCEEKEKVCLWTYDETCNQPVDCPQEKQCPLISSPQARQEAVIALLEQDAQRKKHIDLSHIDLRFVNLVGQDVRSVDLRYADLRGADFSGMDLSGAKLQNANLAGAVFLNATLDKNAIMHACVRGTDFRGVKSLSLEDLDFVTGKDSTTQVDFPIVTEIEENRPGGDANEQFKAGKTAWLGGDIDLALKILNEVIKSPERNTAQRDAYVLYSEILASKSMKMTGDEKKKTQRKIVDTIERFIIRYPRSDEKVRVTMLKRLCDNVPTAERESCKAKWGL